MFLNTFWNISLTVAFFSIICSADKILIFHHVASYSHRVQTWPLAEALQSRGHEVYYISPFQHPHPNTLPFQQANSNISELVPTKMAKFVDEFLNREFDINLRVDNTMGPLIDDVYTLAYGACESLVTSEEFIDWLKVHTKFDLAIVDNCFAECGIGLAHKLGAKYLIFSTVAVIAYEYDAIGFLPESSSVPELETDPPPMPMGFFSRVNNAMWSLRWRWEHYKYSEKIDSLLRAHLKPDNMPHIDDLVRNTSLIFSTGDAISDYPRSLPPLYVNIAGIHCKESTKPLPSDMEAFIGNTNKTQGENDGFIYISLGSLVVSSNLPENIKNIFFETIRSFPNIRFLWKWNGDFPPNNRIPDNLFLGKWFPQLDVLGHPRIKGFVTQSGRPSSLEALFNGVPMISFPILGDQDLNANRMHDMGASIKLEIGTVTTNEFKDAISKVLYDNSFKKRVKKLQRIFRDRPMTPVDTAVWWTEYVLRNEDTHHLKPAGSEQYWFVRRMIDVWSFLTLVVLAAIAGIIFVASKVWNEMFRVNSKLKVE